MPEAVVLELYEEVQGNILMQSIVRHLALDRLYYFHFPQVAGRQRMCKKLGIVTDPAMLNSDFKRG